MGALIKRLKNWSANPKQFGYIVGCISTYNNSLKLSTHAIVIIFIIQEIVSRNQVGFTFFLKKTKLNKKSKTVNLKIEKNQDRTIKLNLEQKLNRTKDKTGPTHEGIDQKTATQP